ncbi:MULTISPECIES: hypothetical protein [Micromonospora]|uniref:YCII-related domain-containing protein n=1 Tax=Micromonospora maris TaxID=1003110 RepID=A0A9X0LFF1_9ACTN|nr:MULTISPECIES: hypothetical protein [Micromonospora]AEB42921.1 hypothetical protein VAB18032_09015 [Micromonospora maris AB-18-032]KUJ48317.1 hypothetical protein ADL17_04460 [Micromonospora maris]RUL92717.1 hypothetical protein EG812_15005 [Verrucosispora sp. FIM060022]
MDQLPTTSLVLVHPGPGWDHSQPLAAQRNAAGHFAWIRRQVDAGTAVVAGPIWRHDERLTGDLVGALVLALPPGKAADLTATDPAVIGGQLTMTTHPYHQVQPR